MKKIKQTNKYVLTIHTFLKDRIKLLIQEVYRLQTKLNKQQLEENESVKRLFRIRKAIREIIPQDPNHTDYYLKGTLAKFRRYKRGLKRYRLLFCFANSPQIIAYLYLNDNFHLRKEGDKNDPYHEFARLVKNKIFSHNPQDPHMQKWLTDLMETDFNISLTYDNFKETIN